MTNLVVTNNDLGGVILKDEVFDDVILAFPGADDYLEGTILARKAVADAVTASAFTGTGDGTVTLATVVGGQVVPIVGAYVLNCIVALTSGGTFELVDPNGAVVAGGLTLTVGAGAATVFEAAGLQFTITDGAADFVVGDTATLTVAADGDVVIYAVDGAGGAQVPSMVLTYEVSATGAEDQAQRAMIGGQVRREKLVIDAGGTVTDSIVDKLRDFGIVALSVDELNIPDNQ
jgi:hypothetical protein